MGKPKPKSGSGDPNSGTPRCIFGRRRRKLGETRRKSGETRRISDCGVLAWGIDPLLQEGSNLGIGCLNQGPAENYRNKTSDHRGKIKRYPDLGEASIDSAGSQRFREYVTVKI